MTRNSTPFSKEDEKWMKKALKLAEKGRGYVSPNPLVGSINRPPLMAAPS